MSQEKNTENNRGFCFRENAQEGLSNEVIFEDRDKGGEGVRGTRIPENIPGKENSKHPEARMNLVYFRKIKIIGMAREL